MKKIIFALFLTLLLAAFINSCKTAEEKIKTQEDEKVIKLLNQEKENELLFEKFSGTYTGSKDKRNQVILKKDSSCMVSFYNKNTDGTDGQHLLYECTYEINDKTIAMRVNGKVINICKITQNTITGESGEVYIKDEKSF